MLVGPVVMNAGQFWLNDNMLKSKVSSNGKILGLLVVCL
jgi:hypothetical protein